jgi:hypothetical protein
VDGGLAELLERCLAKEPEKRPSAGFVAKALRGGTEAAASAGPEQAADGDILQSVLKRRLPQIVVATAVILYALLQFVQMLAEQGVVSNTVFLIALITFGCGVAASGVGAWFHGKKGRQKVQPLEVSLYVVIGVVWLALALFVVLSS